MATSQNQQAPQSLTEDEWNDLFDGVRSTYECSFETMTRQMTPQRYMTLYTYVFNYCTKLGGHGQDLHAQSTSSRSGRGVGTRHQARMQIQADRPDHMYVTLSKYLKQHVKGLMSSLEGHGTGPDQLGAYAKLWRNYDFSSTVVNGIFAYFNQHRAKEDLSMAENAQQNRAVEIRQLAMKVWKETVFDLVQENLTQAILRLIESNRNGEPPSRELLKEALESYIQLGYTSLTPGEDDMEDAPTEKMKVYNEYFEVPFLKATREYYKAEALAFIGSHSMLEYIRKVETRLDEEKVRCELYLHPATMKPLDEVLCEVLIMEQLPAIQAEFEALFKADVVEELARIYAILSRGDRAMEGVLTFTENFIRTKGLEAIDGVKDTAINDPDQYVQTILNVHKHYDEILDRAFSKDTRFVRALDVAHQLFINQNAVTGAAGSSNKTSELLTRYVDSLLRKGGKNVEEQELDIVLSNVITIFKYISDKDVFEKQYQRRLAMRIVNNLSTSDEAETVMMTKLQQICGLDYTTRMMKLFTDKNLSAEIAEQYRNHLDSRDGKKGQVDFGIVALSKNHWPFERESESFQLPGKLEESMEQFTSFYNTKYSGRKLELLLSKSKGEVVCNLQRKYTFVVTTAQMAILLCFNAADQLRFDQLSTMLSMEDSLLAKNLQPMVKEKLLGVAGHDSKELPSEVAGDTLLMFNANFSHKKMKVDLTRFSRAKETAGKAAEDNEVAKQIEMDRKNVVQAAIVRIMKMRKRMQHAQLMSEVIRQTTRFEPTVPTIKKCIEELIEKEYIRRAIDEADTYEYVA